MTNSGFLFRFSDKKVISGCNSGYNNCVRCSKIKPVPKSLSLEQYRREHAALPNQTVRFFVFAILIIYVLIASSVFKKVSAYLATLNLNPWIHLGIVTASLAVLGLGLIVVNKLAGNWITRKMD